jgi:AraC-like DNA-binding protein
MLDIRYFAPHPRLRHIITTYYVYRGSLPEGATISNRLITEFANLRVLVGGDWIGETKADGRFVVPEVVMAGPNSYPTNVSVSGQFRMFGMGIQPLGWTALFRQPAADFADRAVDFAEMVGAADRACAYDAVATITDDEALVARVEDQVFHILAARQARLSPVVRAVQDLLVKQPVNRVDHLSSAVETSARQLERLTKDSFGFSPKTTLRRARIRRTINAMKGFVGRDWETQAEIDYADQSHLIHEFRRFTGMTPNAYLRETNPLMDIGHAMQAALFSKMAQPHPAQQRVQVAMSVISPTKGVRMADAA